MRIAVSTDTNSGITAAMAKEMGVHLLPMPFTINEKEYFEEINLTQEEFYQCLANGDQVVTSQPSAGSILDLWDRLLTQYDQIVHIPMSSGLSGSCENSIMLSNDYNGRVQVVDNHRISVTQLQSVADALYLVSQGKDAKEIKQILEATATDSSIYIMVDTLKYLKKGGRITPAAALIGTALNLKPVLQIQGGKLDAFAKARGLKQGKKIMIQAIQKDMENRFADLFKRQAMKIEVAHTHNDEAAMELKAELEEMFSTEVMVCPLSLSVACHIGPGSLAIACARDLSKN